MAQTITPEIIAQTMILQRVFIDYNIEWDNDSGQWPFPAPEKIVVGGYVDIASEGLVFQKETVELRYADLPDSVQSAIAQIYLFCEQQAAQIINERRGPSPAPTEEDT